MYGLSVEQRKRLTIGVELVANPSVVFMDEPTSGERWQGFLVFGDDLCGLGFTGLGVILTVVNTGPIFVRLLEATWMNPTSRERQQEQGVSWLRV